MDKEIIIKGLKYWIEKHNGEDLLLAFQSVQELYDILIKDNKKIIGSTDDGFFYKEEKCSD